MTAWADQRPWQPSSADISASGRLQGRHADLAWQHIV